MVKWDERWVETFALFFIVIGFIFSVILRNAFFSHITVIIAGIVAGRVFYLKRFKEPIFPFVIIIIGFLLGYVIGSFSASRFVTFIFFVLSFIGSYYLHMKKIITIFKNKNFIK